MIHGQQSQHAPTVAAGSPTTNRPICISVSKPAEPHAAHCISSTSISIIEYLINAHKAAWLIDAASACVRYDNQSSSVCPFVVNK